MACKIERSGRTGKAVVLRVCGRIEAEHISTIQEMIGRENSRVVLDLTEVMLVDRDVVDFLAGCERRGVELRNCPGFLREWVDGQQNADS